MSKAQQQVGESAWGRAVRDAEKEVFHCITGSWDMSMGCEYYRDDYKSMEQYAQMQRDKMLRCMELLEAAQEGLSHARKANDQSTLNDSSEERAARAFSLKVWKTEVEERQVDLLRNTPHVEGGKPFTESHIDYAKRSMSQLDRALERLALARAGLKRVNNG